MSEINESFQISCMQVITYAGSARSLYIQAMRAGRKKDLESARQLIDEGKESYNKAHDAHLRLFNGGQLDVEAAMLAVHAEDQLMSAEIFGILAEELVLEE